MLKRLLEGVKRQQNDGSLSIAIVVADNDVAESARNVVAQFAADSTVPVTYLTQSEKNIALTRNCSVAPADGDFIAFLDDDEFPVEDWLLQLVRACDRFQVAGILGPVRPHFDVPPPQWVIKGRFCERPEPATGTVMDGSKCRTGNVLFRREIIAGEQAPFDPKFHNGGEDVDFFVRMNRKGHTFRWCNEAVAYESVPPARSTRAYMLRRALLRGKNSLKISGGRAALILKSLIAVPLYSIVLPFTLLVGQHVFMKVCIRFCDHLGRLTALVGLNPVSER
jgi:succinoglycan biosynthesis protein ExoM